MLLEQALDQPLELVERGKFLVAAAVVTLRVPRGSVPPAQQRGVLPLLLLYGLGREVHRHVLANEIDPGRAARLAAGDRRFDLEHRAAFVRGAVAAAIEIGRKRSADALPKHAENHVESGHLSDAFLKAADRLVMAAFPPERIEPHVALPDAVDASHGTLGDLALTEHVRGRRDEDPHLHLLGHEHSPDANERIPERPSGSENRPGTTRRQRFFPFPSRGLYSIRSSAKPLNIRWGLAFRKRAFHSGRGS